MYPDLHTHQQIYMQLNKAESGNEIIVCAMFVGVQEDLDMRLDIHMQHYTEIQWENHT